MFIVKKREDWKRDEGEEPVDGDKKGPTTGKGGTGVLFTANTLLVKKRVRGGNVRRENCTLCPEA